MDKSLITASRHQFHERLIKAGVLSITDTGVPSNADKGNRNSVKFSKHIYDSIGHNAISEKLAGQTAGNNFEAICAEFLRETFPALSMVRPGRWDITQTGGRNRMQIAQFQQYQHLIALETASADNPQLRAALGSDYTITPDIVIAREPEPEETFNNVKLGRIVDYDTARATPLREVNGSPKTLHGSISCKWTIRSDRAQNSRSEALNLIRNRKGRLPHIAVVTGEPLPSRIASIALGTGDIDCVYHFALYELIDAVRNDPSAKDQLDIMTGGDRLRDISDLPLDLAI